MEGWNQLDSKVISKTLNSCYFAVDPQDIRIGRIREIKEFDTYWTEAVKYS